MKIRRITSLTALFAFIVMTFTSVILYIVPHGRIAYWSDWHLFGLSKEEWGSIHTNLGLLFLLSLFLHLYYNWKPILSYLKNKTKQIKVFTVDFNVAFIIATVFIIGTHLMLPPFSWVLNAGEHIKNQAAVKYGEPPYGHAELSSVKTFTRKMGLELSESIDSLRINGIKFESVNQTLKEIASANEISPKQIYLAMKSEVDENTKEMPNLLPTGIGKRTLSDISIEYHIDIPTILIGLSDNNLKASSTQTIKEIAKQNNKSPIDVYEIIKELSYTVKNIDPTRGNNS